MSKLLQLPLRICGAVVLLAIAAFCVYGFLCAAEAPLAVEVSSVRLLYGVIGTISIAGAAWLAWPRESGINRS